MIYFESNNVGMPNLDLPLVEKWIMRVAAAYNKKVGNINYLFCDDEEILDTNRKFIDHDYYTDIITFDYSNQHRIAGDIVISLDTVESNAKLVNVGYEEELLRVVIHGVLHLCGINDKGPGEREIMELAENQALDLYKSMNI